MLSKLRFFRSRVGGAPAGSPETPDLSILFDRLGPGLVRLEPVGSGTLGVGFLAELDGRGKFLKTNGIAVGRASLQKEYEVLSAVHGPEIGLERFVLPEANGDRLWLMMDRLHYPGNAYDPAQCLEICCMLEERLTGFPGALEDDMADLIVEGEAAIAALTGADLLRADVATRVAPLLAALRRAWDDLPRLVCHGDLGPMNMMCDAAGAVVVDWEDAFLGFPGYDYLYWLTFFQNRRYYSPAMFGRTGLDRRLEVAVLALIVLVKCEISRLAGRHVGNALSFSQRLEEVLVLL